MIKCISPGSRYLDVPARHDLKDTPLSYPNYIMGGKGRNKQEQSTSSNSCNGHSNLYIRLIKRSACFNLSDVPGFQRRGLTLLHLAAREGDIALDIAQAILSCGCIPINSQTLDDGPTGRTPLYMASYYGQVNMHGAVVSRARKHQC